MSRPSSSRRSPCRRKGIALTSRSPCAHQSFRSEVTDTGRYETRSDNIQESNCTRDREDVGLLTYPKIRTRRPYNLSKSPSESSLSPRHQIRRRRDTSEGETDEKKKLTSGLTLFAVPALPFPILTLGVSKKSLFISLRKYPGQIAFTRMPCRAHSSAKTFVRCVRPAFEAQYDDKPAIPDIKSEFREKEWWAAKLGPLQVVISGYTVTTSTKIVSDYMSSISPALYQAKASRRRVECCGETSPNRATVRDAMTISVHCIR